MRAPARCFRFFLALLAACANASAPAAEANPDFDAVVCAAAAQTIIDATHDSGAAVLFEPGGDQGRVRCVIAALARPGHARAAHDAPGIVHVLLRAGEIGVDKASARLALSACDATQTGWTHFGRLEFTAGAGQWRFARYRIDRYIHSKCLR
ncbi:MAG: hypothetical protein ABI846_03645 [Rudaea sp.]